MKVLFKKLKKTHIAKKIFYFLTSILYIASLTFITIEALIFKNTEPILLSILLAIFIIWGIIYNISGLITMISKKHKAFIALTVNTLIISIVLGLGAFYIHQKKDLFNNTNRTKIIYTTNLIALKETKFNEEDPIGMIESVSDIEGNELAKKLIKEENIKNEIYYYEDYQAMIYDLYNGKIVGCFVSSNYEIIFEDDIFKETEDSKESLADRVKVLFDYSEEKDNQDIITLTQSENKTLTEPFTVLIMGVDSALDGLKANQAFNGDTLIMVTFNPNTLSATMFSLQRDLYVPIACNHNRYGKLSSSAAYGSSCVINTVQQLTGIDIDYYVKINFTGVVELIDALGGVTVDVEEPDFRYNGKYDCKGTVCEQNSKRKKGKSMVYVPTGVQKLNGEQALAYARNRHQYAIGDFARNEHQQQIIEATAKQAKNINSITEVEKILETVSNNIETNMSLEQMLSFYSVGKDMLLNSTGSSLSIKRTSLACYGQYVWRPNTKSYTSTQQYYQESLDAIVNLMKENLNLKESKPIKTFKISYNENYKTPIVGKGLYGGTKVPLVKSFIGATEYEATAWCEEVGITCNFETTTNYQTAGLIVEQSAHEKEFVKALKSITFYISDGLGTPPIPDTPTPDTNINIDTDGDGIPDTNLDTDGDGIADTNIKDNTTPDNNEENNDEENKQPEEEPDNENNQEPPSVPEEPTTDNTENKEQTNTTE